MSLIFYELLLLFMRILLLFLKLLSLLSFLLLLLLSLPLLLRIFCCVFPVVVFRNIINAPLFLLQGPKPTQSTEVKVKKTVQIKEEPSVKTLEVPAKDQQEKKSDPRGITDPLILYDHFLYYDDI